MDLVGVGFWIDRRYLSANAARSPLSVSILAGRSWMKAVSRTDAIISSSVPSAGKIRHLFTGDFPETAAWHQNSFIVTTRAKFLVKRQVST